MRVIFIFSILMFGFHLELSTQCTPSANSTLNVNNVEAGVLNKGFMWWDGVSNNTFKFPTGSHYSPLFSKSMVISAFDGDNLKMASAVRFNSGVDFFPGPLNSNGEVLSFSDCTFYNQIFEMRSANVVDHINMYLTSSNPLSFTNIHQSILDWPARGNTYLASNGINIENDLAPFIDWNNNGIYDPENGDYPNIKGNQALFWVMNDVAGSHGSGGNKLYIEVQMMAYAYQSNVPVINNTTFYDYTIIRKKPTPLHEAYFSLYFLDNIQNFTNYFGCDTTSNLFFTYESLSSNLDFQNAPIHLLKLIDCNKEKKMSSFVADYRVPGAQGTQPYYEVSAIRNHQKGMGRCGVLFYYGGNGRHGCGVTDEVTKFMFTGDPSDSTQWSMQHTDPDSNACPQILDITDRFVYMNYGPYTLNSFEPLKFTFASTLVPTDNLEYPLGKIDMVPPAETIEQYYCTTCKDGNYYGVNPPDFTSIDNIDVLDVQIYPNPMSKSFEINTSSNIENVELIDTYGKSIKKWEGKQASYSVDKMNRGIYFLQIAINGQRIIKKVIIE